MGGRVNSARAGSRLPISNAGNWEQIPHTLVLMHPNSVLSCLVLLETPSLKLIQHLSVRPSLGPDPENQAAAYVGNRAQQCQTFQGPVPGQQLHKS